MPKTYLKVGLFSICIILLFIISYAWLTNRLNTKNQREISILFDDIAGLEIGDKIEYKGMEAGRVRSLSITPDGIICSGKIDSGIVLYEGTSFYVEDSSLMGGKHLVIDAVKGDIPLDLNKIQTGLNKPGMMAAISKGVEAIEEFKSIMAELKSENGLISQSEDLLGSAKHSLHKVDTKLDNIERDLNKSILLINTTVSQVNTMLMETKDPISKSAAKLPPLMQNISVTMDSLQIVSARLNRTLQEINSGKGSTAKLIQDPELYQRMVKSLENLDKLISDIKTNPKKYLKFSVF